MIPLRFAELFLSLQSLKSEVTEGMAADARGFKCFMMNCVKQLSVYQRRMSTLTRNFMILHHITLVRFAVDSVECLTDGAHSAMTHQAGIMADAVLNGFPEGKTSK